MSHSKINTQMKTRTEQKLNRASHSNSNARTQVLEILASFLSRTKDYPILSITSAMGCPEWLSNLEAQNLSIGLCDFTCCERNHIFENRVVPCDRGICHSILEVMTDSKVKFLFTHNKWRLARIFAVGERDWCLRGLSSAVQEKTPGPKLTDFKIMLQWDNAVDGIDEQYPWNDRTDTSILMYAVAANKIDTVREILELYKNRSERLLAWTFPEDGLLEFGMPGRSSILHVAMMVAGPDVVAELLSQGAKAHSKDVMGNDPLMMACVFNNLSNIQMWLKMNPDWKIDRRNERFGSTALHFAVYLGPQKFDTVKFLIEKHNADVNISNKSGSSALILACGNEDCDPKVVRYLVEETGVDVNRQIKSTTTMWKLMRATARFAVNSKMTRSKFLRQVAESSGLTALHYAARRGDMEIVELLLEYGAKSSIKNDLGRDVLS